MRVYPAVTVQGGWKNWAPEKRRELWREWKQGDHQRGKEFKALLRIQLGSQEKGKEGRWLPLPPSSIRCPSPLHPSHSVLCCAALCVRCAECGEHNPTDFHHVKPHLKVENFGNCQTVGQIKKELALNTKDGVIYVQAICKECHDAITWPGEVEVNSTIAAKKEFVTKLKCSNGGKCMYEHCTQPDYICTPANARSFPLDHLHPAACKCAVCTADPTLRKRACVGTMVYGGGWSLHDVERECREGVVRVVHYECHLLITSEQWKANMWEKRKVVQAVVDAVEEEEEEVEEDSDDEDGEMSWAEDEEGEEDKENPPPRQPSTRPRRFAAVNFKEESEGDME